MKTGDNSGASGAGDDQAGTGQQTAPAPNPFAQPAVPFDQMSPQERGSLQPSLPDALNQGDPVTAPFVPAKPLPPLLASSGKPGATSTAGKPPTAGNVSQGNDPESPSTEDVARSAPFNFTDDHLQNIRANSQQLIDAQSAVREGASAAAETLIPQPWGSIISGTIDLQNHVPRAFRGAKGRDDLYQKMLWKEMNDILIQQQSERIFRRP